MIPLGRWGYIRPGIASSRQPLRIAIMSDCRYDRRTLLKNALVGLAALPASGLIREAAAQERCPTSMRKRPWRCPWPTCKT